MNILNLPSYNILDVSEEDHGYRVTVESNEPTERCAHCRSNDFIRHGQHRQLFLDTPMHGNRTSITVVRKRFRCKECRKTFMEALPDIDDRRKSTTRLVKHIERLSLERTFASIADDVGVDEKTIRNIFRDYVNELESTIEVETPRWLGIDEVHLNKTMRCVITNIEKRTLVEMLPTRTKNVVIAAFNQLPNKDNVEYVAMDMWRPYKDAVGVVFPKAICVIDKFHVLKLASEGLESARKALKSKLTNKERRTLKGDRYVLLKRPHNLSDRDALKLSGWMENFPVLAEAYTAKETFYGIWDAGDRTKAEQLYESWLDGISREMQHHFHPLTRAMNNWHTEIFNYFDHPITNAYTESLNGVIKVMHRMGRGYSFDALRARMLLSNRVRRKPVRAHQTPTAASYSGLEEMPFGLVAGEPIYDYGASIDTLLGLIEKDD